MRPGSSGSSGRGHTKYGSPFFYLLKYFVERFLEGREGAFSKSGGILKVVSFGRFRFFLSSFGGSSTECISTLLVGVFLTFGVWWEGSPPQSECVRLLGEKFF